MADVLHEALVAADLLSGQGIDICVVNMPWLNRIDGDWLAGTVAEHTNLFVLEDHAPTGGLADRLLATLADRGLLDGRRFKRFAVRGFPAWGRPPEVLRHHGLDGASLAAVVAEVVATE